MEHRQECERAVLIKRYILSCIDMSLITQLMTIIHPSTLTHSHSGSITRPTISPTHVSKQS
jgi:hypothetical protein